MKKVILLLFIQCFVFSFLTAQDADNTKEKVDSTENKLKITYEKLNKEGDKKEGLFNLYKVKSDYYFELDKTLFDKDFLVVNKISKVPYEVNGHGINKGMAYETKMIRFEYDKDASKVWVKTLNPKVHSPENNLISKSLSDNSIASVIEYFDIQSKNEDSTSVVIKVNKIFDGTEKSFSDLLNSIGLGGSVKSSLSKIESIKTFPQNVVAKSLITTGVTEGSTTLPISIGITSNIVLLPEDIMTPRFEDDRIGYFSKSMDYYNDIQQEVDHRRMITRWRLEPKEEDIEKYKNGELVEPKKQIVYYIDPATPKQWIPFIEQGVLDWNTAFEEAGFKNTVVVKKVTEADKDFDIDDVRYSVIVYTASTKINAMGPSIVDPRSGEILEADIIWWHNLMKGLRSWIRVQTGPIDKSARRNLFTKKMMGEAIRFVSSHEVGHTFGLKHNMGASHSFPVDSLRSPSFTSRMNGTAPSIMDYARYNYVAQPGDGVTTLNPKIGVYDIYAIDWGYRWLDTKDEFSETSILNKMILEHSDDPLYTYGAQQREVVDPRSQSEDLGDDAIKASNYGIKNLKRIVPNIEDWTYEDGKTYYKAAKLYHDVIGQWQTYNNHVIANIGGMYVTPTIYRDGKKTYEPVPANIQKRALEFIVNNGIKYQQWLFSPEHIQRFFYVKDAPDGARYYSPLSVFRDNQAYVFYNLLKTERLERIAEYNIINPDTPNFNLDYLFDRLYDVSFSKTKKSKSLDQFERVTQKNFVDVLIVSRNRMLKKLNKNKAISYSEVQSVNNANFGFISRIGDVGSYKHGMLNKILKLIKIKRRTGDQATQYHYEDLISRIENHLN